jgi:RNA polymerase-binding transcription factor DksA
MAGVARETRADNSESSPFSTHNGDAGSDACDRDFALSLLSQERNALFEIDQALQRIELGIYGTCEMSGQPIPVSRLEAIPFARFTVEWQSEIEKRRRLFHDEQSFPSPFAVADEEETDEPDQS